METKTMMEANPIKINKLIISSAAKCEENESNIYVVQQNSF